MRGALVASEGVSGAFSDWQCFNPEGGESLRRAVGWMDGTEEVS
jgi:hypothetical protein